MNKGKNGEASYTVLLEQRRETSKAEGRPVNFAGSGARGRGAGG
jgi:hypothetical protein